MSILSFNLLRSYFAYDPKTFINTANGYDSVSKIYSALTNQLISNVKDVYSPQNATIVRMDMDGNILYSDNNFSFSKNKMNLLNNPGSVKSEGIQDILVTNPVENDASIIAVTSNPISDILSNNFDDGSTTDLDGYFLAITLDKYNPFIQQSNISWKYTSDKKITSFCLVPKDIHEIHINDDAIRNMYSFVRQNATVKWVNNSNKPISIYSGTTNHTEFDANPDLGLYGKEFKSPVLQPGESWSYKFVNIENYNWFVYPDILVGTVAVVENRVNSQDEFLLAENENIDQPLTSRIIKIDYWGNVLWSFGESYLVKTRGIHPRLNGNIIINA